MDKKNDKKLITNRLLVLCGVTLLGCWLLKLSGGVVFDFVVTNETTISICNFIENSVVKYVIYWMFYVFNCLLGLLIIGKQKTFQKKHLIIYLIIYTLLFLLNFYSNLAKTILDICAMILIPIFVYKTKWWHSVLYMISFLLLQFVLLQIRNVGYTLYYANFLVGLLTQLDYYIVLVIMYIRRNY